MDFPIIDMLGTTKFLALFSLPVFPEGSLATSVVTTVWLGVFVSVMFNLRLGWTLSGLVVPGYLVPLLIMKPWSAVIVVIEGILTYAIVWFFSEYLSRFRKWSNLFGRDRFFGLILVSIVVRVVLDGFVLPLLARELSARWLDEFDFAGNLHSFGLIIIALIANQFWKPGLRRGLFPFAMTIGVTYLLVRYPLMHLTNFSMASLEYMYEDVSASVFASPKAYIILVTTAYIASRMNLIYSWEFNGIVIPSLLALQWYEPLKILTSFVEAWLIYFAAIAILKLPWLREMSVEGGRKILLFFNISFLYKMILGHVVAFAWPAVQVTDVFGFGYLLPSLLAAKMHDKGIPERITRTTLQTSLVGTFAASLLGFCLTLAPQEWLLDSPPEEALAESSTESLQDDLVNQLRADKILLYEQRLVVASFDPMQREIDHFANGLRHLRSYLRHGEESSLAEAREWFGRVRFRLDRLKDGHLYLRELPPRRGWGLYVFKADARSGLVIEVPAPLEEWATFEAGAFFFRVFESQALAVSTAARSPDWAGKEILTSRRSFFDMFHRVFGHRDVLQVRAYTASARRAMGDDVSRGASNDAEEQQPSNLWIKSSLPETLRLSLLKRLLKTLRVEWREPPHKNIQRDFTKRGFADLFLRRQDRKALLARFLLGSDTVEEEAAFELPELVGVDGERLGFQQYVLRAKDHLAGRGTNQYLPATSESLLFLDEEVVSPLLRLVMKSWEGGLTPGGLVEEIRAIHAPALSLGYSVMVQREPESDQTFVVLAEPASGTRRYWGTYIFRIGAGRPFAVEIPHPGYERNTLEYGLSLFEKLDAAVLLVAGSHPKSNTDNSADVVLAVNKSTVFNLVNQVVLRETSELPFMIVQVRAYGHKPGVVLPEADALLSFLDGTTSAAALTPLGVELHASLRDDRMTLQFVDGSVQTAGYEAHGSAQARYLTHTLNKEFAALWLSPYTRFGFRQDPLDGVQEALFQRFGIPSELGDLQDTLAAGVQWAKATEVPAEFVRAVERYQITRDMNVLRNLSLRWPGLRLQRFLDVNTQKAFLIVHSGEKVLPLVARLTMGRNVLLNPRRSRDFRAAAPLAAEDVQGYVESGAQFLFVE